VKPRISFVTLGVADLERSRRFYVDGLGLPVRQPENEGVVFLDMGSMVLGLWGIEDLKADAGYPSAVEGFRGMSIAHNVPTKEEVDAVLQQAVDAGGTLVKAGHDAPWGGHTGYFADPDGHLWEVAWNPFMPDLAADPTP
jgi:catechol 2,3-dioxygenase-like lactoylglutathione lyase family enzyme